MLYSTLSIYRIANVFDQFLGYDYIGEKVNHLQNALVCATSYADLDVTTLTTLVVGQSFLNQCPLNWVTI